MKITFLKFINKKNDIIKSIIALIITVFFIYYIYNNLNFNEFKSIINETNLYFIVGALFIHGFAYAVRSIRIMILLNINFSHFRNIYFTISRHYLFNKILPFRIGELSLIYFLRNEQKISYTRGIGALFYIRILDLLIILLYFSIAFLINTIFFFNKNNMGSITIFIYILVLLVILFLIFIFLGKIINYIYRFFIQLTKKTNIFNKKFYYKFLDKLEIFSYEINSFIKAKSNKKIILLTMLNRLLHLLVIFIIFLAFGVIIRFDLFIVGSTLSLITNILPVNGIGGFGSFEAGWTIGFSLLGHDKSVAFLYGFGINIIVFFFTLFLLVVGYFLYKFKKNSKNLTI